MALIDRVKERTPSDLTDTELQAMINAISAENTARFGPDGEITVHLGEVVDGDTRGRQTLRLSRPLDDAQPVAVAEIDPGWSGDTGAETELSADDFRVLHGGRTLQRLRTGTNGRDAWAPLVRVTYTPRGVTGARDEAVIRLMQIDTANTGGLKSERAGDYSWTAMTGDERAEAREAVFNWLTGALSNGQPMMA